MMRRTAYLIALTCALGACSKSAERGTTPPPSTETATQPGAPMSTATYTKPDDATLRDKLSDMQYRVTQEDGTEPPFRNELWDNKDVGLYVDIVSGEPLFTSLDKFDSGTGWPSFTKPVEKERVVERHDTKHGMERTEVRSKSGDSHLGHLFSDGPAPTGLRYCINSASLRFIPVDELEEEGYGAYLPLFENAKKK